MPLINEIKATTKRDLLKEYMEQKILSILHSANTSARNADLARLRRGIGKAPGELADLWGILLLGMDRTLCGKDGYPSIAQRAAYTALTLMAFHQQGHDPEHEPMHLSGQTLGQAAASLVIKENNYEEALERILKKLQIAASSDNVDHVSYYLRGLVQMMRAKSVPMDYAQLAVDLYDYHYEEGRTRVRLRWGQDLLCNNKNIDEGQDTLSGKEASNE